MWGSVRHATGSGTPPPPTHTHTHSGIAVHQGWCCGRTVGPFAAVWMVCVRWGGRDVLQRPYTAGGGVPPLTPLPPPPPPLPMFEADSQDFASAPSVPRGFMLQTFSPAFGGGP